MITLPRRAALMAPFLTLLPAAARANGWRPNQPMKLLVAAAPGGTTDMMARLFAAHLQARWGSTVVVDNKGGGGGTIAGAEVARAAPDMLTLLCSNIGPQSIAYSLFRNLSYKPANFQPVSNMIRTANVLVVHPSVPVSTVPEFIAHLRRNPGKLTYGTAGVGQSPHVCGAWFNQLTGTDAAPVHYRGSAPAMLDLMAGNTQFMFDNLSTAIQQIHNGAVKALAVTSAERNPRLPELPALRETMPELAEYEMNSWFGIFAPAGVPRPALQAVNLEIKAMLETPEAKARLNEMAGAAAYGTPEEFTAFVNNEIEKWGAVVRREGVQIDAT